MNTLTKRNIYNRFFIIFLSNGLIQLFENGMGASTEVMCKQWLIVTILTKCDDIFNKEVLLWKQRWVITNKLRYTCIIVISRCDELPLPKVY